jgi:hypothetical protein
MFIAVVLISVRLWQGDGGGGGGRARRGLLWLVLGRRVGGVEVGLGGREL